MTMKKYLVPLLLAACATIGLTGCTNNDTSSSQTASTPTTAAPTETPRPQKLLTESEAISAAKACFEDFWRGSYKYIYYDKIEVDYWAPEKRVADDGHVYWMGNTYTVKITGSGNNDLGEDRHPLYKSNTVDAETGYTY